MDVRSPAPTIAVALMLACGYNAEGNGDPTIPPPTGQDSNGNVDQVEPELECGPTFGDDMVLAYGDQAEASDEIIAVASVDGTPVVGGDGFAAVFDGSDLGSDLDIDGDVTALAAIDDEHVAIGTSKGEVIVAKIDGDDLEETGSVDVGARVRGLASDGDAIWAAASGEGVRELAFDDGDVSSEGAFGNVKNARGIAFADDSVIVAAGGAGVVVLDTKGEEIGTVATDSPVDNVVAKGDLAIALRSAQGWDLIELGGDPKIEASIPTGGISVDAVLLEDEVLVVEGYAVTRWALDGGSPEMIGIEDRRDVGELVGTWLRGMAPMGDGGWVVIDDAAVVPFYVEAQDDAPNIAVDVPNIAMWGDPGDEAQGVYLIRNTGTDDLLIGEVEADGDFKATLQTDTVDEHDDCDDHYVVPAGGNVLIDIEFDAGNKPSEGTLTVLSNDPDHPRLEIPLQGNGQDLLEEGDEVLDFTGLTLDGELFRLSDHEGKVIFLKLFNFGCATCAEEFPEIESDLLPAYSEDDFIAVGVNTTHRTSYADELAAMTGISMPVVLDVDSETFRYYRIPQKVFPLHIVLGRDGKIAHINNEKGIEAVTVAIDAAM